MRLRPAVEGGDDLRHLPLSLRKANLERLLARRPEAIFITRSFAILTDILTSRREGPMFTAGSIARTSQTINAC